DWESGKAATTLKAKDEKIDGGIIAVRFMADGTLVGCAESQSSGAIWFWKPGESEPFHAIAGQSLYEVDLHPGGRLLPADRPQRQRPRREARRLRLPRGQHPHVLDDREAQAAPEAREEV